jgi:hypothetical protein
MGRAVPELIFHSSCDKHDRCYHNKPFGANEAGRRKCDSQFLDNMLDDCKDRWRNNWTKRNLCKVPAKKYYGFVSNLGKPFFFN